MNKTSKITMGALLALALVAFGATALHTLNTTRATLAATQAELERASWMIGEVVDVWTDDTHHANGTLARRVVGIVFYDDTVMYYEVYPEVIYLGRVYLLK